MPPQAKGMVIFAHGSGSSRRSERNRFVAEKLNETGLATLLFDLLTTEENVVDERTRALRFDISLLTLRLTGAVDWLKTYHPTERLSFGLFGASTGAAAALRTAAERPEEIKAVVSRGGRTDMAGDALAEVGAPSLFIVGGNDPAVLEYNRRSMGSMRCHVELKTIPGATHLFEEPGALEEVARLAGDWFLEHL